MRGIGHQHLHGRRADADAQRGRQERQRVAGEARRQQGRSGDAQQHQDQPPVLHQIAQRYDEQQAQAIAELGQGDDQAS
ncbi:hypothetical protein GALL_301650 [mine drainage metagenome]|uniref:Uncharacterized protein n=1 Tax=mine drainage metagenome TaxID=410659 RepID=A0A1J5QWC4_9ZZZZ